MIGIAVMQRGESMGRMIDEDDVIHILEQYTDTEHMQGWVRSLPSAQPEQQWIPCSERLPEKDQICIVTDDTQRCAYEYGLHNETYDEVNGWTYLGHKIIAWMPLPESYKGEKE